MDYEVMQTGIYCIEKSLFEGLQNEQIIQNIIETYNSKVSHNERFEEQGLISDTTLRGFTVNVFYSQKKRRPRWVKFLEPVLDPESSGFAGAIHGQTVYLSAWLKKFWLKPSKCRSL